MCEFGLSARWTIDDIFGTDGASQSGQGEWKEKQGRTPLVFESFIRTAHGLSRVRNFTFWNCEDDGREQFK